MVILKTIDLCKQYGEGENEVHALDHVSIAVEDHNGAISREEQNRIFRRFYRGENSTGKEGIGLGLYITREIALRQGGYVAVKATEKGNIFSIYLRL